MNGDTQIAGGYFGGRSAEVSIAENVFTGSEALELRSCGSRGLVERNDSTGPSEYREGECMPGLTPAGVLAELTRECRRCSECPGGPHHWLQPDHDPETNRCFVPCKHCDVEAALCEACFECAVWPPRHGTVCEDCLRAQAEDYRDALDHEDSYS